MSIEQALSFYLYRYKSLCLPGLGQISFVVSSAEIRFADRSIEAGKTSLVVTEERGNANQLISWVARQLAISTDEAERQVNQLISDWKGFARTKQGISWPGVGRLYLDERGKLQIQQQAEEVVSQSSVPAEKVIRTGAVHTVLVGEEERSSQEMEEILQQKEPVSRSFWWIAAIGLLLLGVCALWMIKHDYPDSWNKMQNHRLIPALKNSPQYEQIQ